MMDSTKRTCYGAGEVVGWSQIRDNNLGIWLMGMRMI